MASATNTKTTPVNKNDEGDKNTQNLTQGSTKTKKGITINPKKEDLMSESELNEKKKLDPVGKEDSDIDNDGDVDKSDKYLNFRRKVRTSMIKRKQKMKEEIAAELRNKQLVSEEPEKVDEVAVTGAALPASTGATSHSNTSKAKSNMKSKMLAATAEYDKKKKEARG